MGLIEAFESRILVAKVKKGQLVEFSYGSLEGGGPVLKTDILRGQVTVLAGGGSGVVVPGRRIKKFK